MDPFKDCKRIYKLHFRERIGQRHLPANEVNDILKNGTSTHQGNGIYRIRYGIWIIVLKAYHCRIVLRTAFHK